MSIFVALSGEDFDAAFELTESVLSPEIKTIGLIGALQDLQVSKERELGFGLPAKRRYGNDRRLWFALLSRGGKKVLDKWVQSRQFA